MATVFIMKTIGYFRKIVLIQLNVFFGFFNFYYLNLDIISRLALGLSPTASKTASEIGSSSRPDYCFSLVL